jgi:hypothetical protein
MSDVASISAEIDFENDLHVVLPQANPIAISEAVLQDPPAIDIRALARADVAKDVLIPVPSNFRVLT